MINSISNHIEEYFAKTSDNAQVLTARALFEAKPKEVEVKTDLTHREIMLITALNEFDRHLKKLGLKPIYEDILNDYERLLISKDRKSRGEFVDMHRAKDNTAETLNTMSRVGDIITAKK